ncbi:uncharacterized protein MELLADRAFT_41186 [Melampsora larici-populina 98AG31]|uniref:Protein kinase domain-containing protein n=1 Tax=Melampsora larici-populina (strain 98AG31 / pathotype 3-4-7) TaxID=747676 RepID=F4SCB2_MELLP|nr:uncharacterized protein MELLADRAFT_41186 [Melampsora larici-populina 98AG31]EGF97718.1 hypothetical protein MELLADRAFT_41186 [Melampsora larici-populina 98AG31]
MALTPQYDRSDFSLEDCPHENTEPLSPDDFEILKQIGSGGFGSVHKAIYKRDRSSWAIKKLERFTEGTSNILMIMNEIALLDAVDHPNIIQLFGFYLTDEDIHLVLELAPKGDLGHMLFRGNFSESKAKHFVLQIAEALEYLHENQIIHRDVKTLNVLLMNDDQIKLTDFGTATVVDSSGSTRGDVGTPYSRAPEIILKQSYSKNVDWWSLGVLLYELVTGQQPFHEGMSQIFHFSSLLNLLDLLSHLTDLTFCVCFDRLRSRQFRAQYLNFRSFFLFR